ncbi:MAG: HEAT repeat domain-containing protein, partial [Nitrospirota bacterium]
SDERGRVRLGTAALVESLGEEHREEIASRVPALCELLAHDDPVVKGDVVYLLGAIGSEEALACLRTAAGKEHDPRIRELMEETLAEISEGN